MIYAIDIADNLKQFVLKHKFHLIKQVFLKTYCVQTWCLPVGTKQAVHGHPCPSRH